MKKIVRLAVFLPIMLSATAISEEHKHATISPSNVDSNYIVFKEKNDAVMAEMHKNMHEAQTVGNADIDFMIMMIPHHQGAIDMAQLILETSTDREVRNLALGIITEQKNEIELMKKLVKDRSK